MRSPSSQRSGAGGAHVWACLCSHTRRKDGKNHPHLLVRTDKRGCCGLVRASNPAFAGFVLPLLRAPARRYLQLQALRETVWPLETLLEALTAATEADVVAHLRKVLSACHVEVLAIGNITAEEASGVARAVAEAATPPCGLPSAEWPVDRVVRLLPGDVVLSQVGKNRGEPNSATQNFYQVHLGNGPAHSLA